MFRYLAVRSLVVQIIAGVMAIIAACWGAGVLCAYCSVYRVLYLFVFHKLYKKSVEIEFLENRMGALQENTKVSSYQFLFDILNYFSVNLDNY